MQISTNMPSIGSVVLEIALELLEKSFTNFNFFTQIETSM